MALKAVKNKIRSVKKTGQVTKAMEAVSAVKMRKSQERALEGRPYAVSALSILKRLSGSVLGLRHPLSQKREIHTLCLVVVTSDRGLAGNLNNAVLKEAGRMLKEKNIPKEHIAIIAIGRKALDYFSRRKYTIAGSFTNMADDVSVHDMKEITSLISERFMKGEYDECVAVYTNFVSTFEQNAMSRVILPLTVSEIETMILGILPQRGKYAGKEEKRVSVYTIEPNPEEVLEELIPSLVNILLYHALLEAKASEHSARMVAMKNASEKAQEMSKELNLEFNREHQAMITREVNEITSGIEAMI